MGSDRADVEDLAECPARTSPHWKAGARRCAQCIQHDPLLEPHRNLLRFLPHDFPGHGTVYFYYAAWRDEGIFAQLKFDLTALARVKEGRMPEPTASVIGTQSVKTSTNAPP